MRTSSATLKMMTLTMSKHFPPAGGARYRSASKLAAPTGRSHSACRYTRKPDFSATLS
jgi:hypothetical protein